MKKSLLPLFAAVMLTGCYKTNLNNFSVGGSPGNVEKTWNHSFLFGLIPISTTDLTSLCGDKGAWAVSTRQNVWGVLLTSITWGIYSPTVAVVTCKS